MIYNFWDIEQYILKLVILGPFLLFYPSKNQKNHYFEKWKKLQEISSFYACVPKITIIWYMVPEIWSEAGIIFCHFGPYFALLPPPTSPNDLKNQNFEKRKKRKKKKMHGDIILWYIYMYHKWRSYDIWFLKYKVQQTEIFDILGHFLPFQLHDNLENQNFNIEKSSWRYCFTHLHHYC